MKRLSLSKWSLGVKLSVLTSFNVAILFFILTLSLTHNAAKQLETLTLDNMQNQVAGIDEAAGMFNATLNEDEISKASLLAPINATRNTFLLIGLALVMIFALSFLWIPRRWLRHPLQQVIALAQHYAAGNRQATLATERQDEPGQLIHAINGIGDGLERIASQALTRVAEAANAVKHGGDTVTRSVNTMSAISVSSQSIADITHVIESIAFPDQYPGTEHAGEYGKGFTVVAAEVRALAQRSARAVKEIDGPTWLRFQSAR